MGQKEDVMTTETLEYVEDTEGEVLDLDPVGIDIPDAQDIDPLYSELTGKSYKTERGKKMAETRFRNKFGSGSAGVDKPSMTNTQLRKGIQSFYETAATVVGLFSVPDGQVIMDAAPGCSVAMAEWAESDPRVRAALEKLMSGSTMSKVIMAHAPIALGIMANHGVNPLARFFPTGE